MDLNPDEAIAAGWLKENSTTSRVLQRMLKFSFRQAARTIVLDRFMKDRVVAKEIDSTRIAILPPWAHDDHVSYSEAGREAFRLKHELSDRFVVMYSGNHSPCHPLDTLLDAALTLRMRAEIVFCFVGGGSEQLKVREFVVQHGLNNIKCLPYRPLKDLSASLSAADLHVVVMGEPFVGIVHPCKVYNIMSIGVPALYIGPQPSHVTDIASQRQHRFFLSDHGDLDAVTAAILECQQDSTVLQEAVVSFSKEKLLPQFISLIESLQDVQDSSELPKSEQDVQDFSGLPKSENAVPSPGR